MSSPKRWSRTIHIVLVLATVMTAQFFAGTGWALSSLLVLVASLALVATTCDLFDIRRVTIVSFWYLSYLAMISFPAFLVYADQQEPYRGRFLFAVESVLVTVPLGWWIANRYFHYHREEIERYFTQPIDRPDSCPQLYPRLRLLLLALAILTGLYVREVGTIPLLYLIRNPGDYLQLVFLREESFKLLDSPLKYMYALARGLGYPLLIFVSFGCFLYDRKGRWRTIFLISLTAGLFFASLSLAKSPVASIFLGLAMLFYIFRRGLLNRRVVAALLGIILLFPIGVVLAISSQDATLAMALVGTGVRLFYFPAEDAYYYFEVFPSHVPYLGGRSIEKLAWLLGMPYFDTPNYVGLYATPHAMESINANAAFIADLNADFGIAGVILGGVLTGFIMQSIQIYVLRRRKTVVSMALFAFLMVTFWYLNSMSLPVVLASNGTLLAVVLAWLLERSPQHAPIDAVQQV